MRIVMIPGLCSNEHRTTGGTFCESCFAAFLLHGCYPDRPCITAVVDDGSDETTLVLRYGDQEKVVPITEETARRWPMGAGRAGCSSSRSCRARP
jgi:hypothetical protein